MTFGGERAAVQNPFIRYAVEAGWTYLPPDEALRLRGGIERTLLRPVFVEMAQRLNPYLDATGAEDLARRIERVAPRIEGNLDAWEYLKGLKTVFVPEEKRERNARLVDADHWEANRFHVTNELRFTNGTHTIRLDLAFFVNGIPVLLVETKAAYQQEGIARALDQLRRYHREGPELMALLQVQALTHLVQFYYGPTWNLSRKGLFNWKEQAAGDFETLVKTFVHPQRILRVLLDFILFTRKDDELGKVILHPHQMRAVERVVRRAADPDKRRAGTENVAGIVGLGKAVELALAEMEEEAARLAALRERLWKGIAARVEGVRRNGHPTQALPGTLNVCFEYIEGESIILSLDMKGVAVSSGSACTSDSLEPSHVLLAMGVPPAIAQGSVRFSLGRDNTVEQVDYVVSELPAIIEQLRAMSPFSEQEPFTAEAGPRTRKK